MDRYELRRQDYALSVDQGELQRAYRDFLSAHCPLETVRAAEATGFDADLWRRWCATGAASMALPEVVGGDGATLVDLVLVAEELGRRLAPLPWIDHVCGARLLARLGVLDDAAVVSGESIVGLDAVETPGAGPRLVPSGAVAAQVLVRDGDDVVRLTHRTPPAGVANIGCLPMAWIDPAAADTCTVLASGPDAAAAHRLAMDEWRLLTAAALAGLVEETMTIAARFATTRYTLGVPIGSLQGISHPLADVAVAVEGGRALARRAAWYLDHEPAARPELAPAAFVFLADVAPRAATTAVQVQGGLGVSAEAAATAYLVRARGWSLAGGDPAATAVRIGRLVAERESA